MKMVKQCASCGAEFIPSSPRQIYCKNPHYRTCPICGKSYLEKNYDKLKYPPTTCSIECRTQKRTNTSMEKYGIPAPGNTPSAREKAKQTMNKLYGVDYAQSSKEIRQKSKNTWIGKYGVDNPQKDINIKEKTKSTNIERYGTSSYLNSNVGSAQIRQIMQEKYGTCIPLRNATILEKCKQTNLKKYGTINPMQNDLVKQRGRETSLRRYGTIYPQSSEIVKQHIKDTFIKKYGVDNCFKSEKIIEKIKQSFYEHYGVHSVMEAEEIAAKIRETNMRKYGVPYGIMTPNARKYSTISRINKEISKKLDQAGIFNQKEFCLNKKSYDIYIPQGNILLEIDPTYTHNSVGNHWGSGVSRWYHLRKTLIAQKYGYRCIHLWDWDCVSKFIDSLTTKHIIYGKTNLEIIDGAEAEQFIQKYSIYDITENLNHILFIGIRYKSKLMLLMGFKLVDIITNTWMLVTIDQRFQYTIYNGNNLLLDHFKHICHPRKIIAYADFSKTNGEMLENMGFTYTKFVPPNKIWSKGRHAIVDVPDIIPEVMHTDNWLPVYNCGYKIYEMDCVPSI